MSNRGAAMTVGEIAEQAKREGVPASLLLSRVLNESEDLDRADAESPA